MSRGSGLRGRRESNPRAGRVDQHVEAIRHEPAPPLAHRNRVAVERGRDLGLRTVPVGTGRQDLGAQRHGLRRLAARRPALEGGPFICE